MRFLFFGNNGRWVVFVVRVRCVSVRGAGAGCVRWQKCGCVVFVVHSSIFQLLARSSKMQKSANIFYGVRMITGLIAPSIFQLLPRSFKNGYLANKNRKNCWQIFDIWVCVATFYRILQQHGTKSLLPS
jgi:hypothetical protein